MKYVLTIIFAAFITAPSLAGSVEIKQNQEVQPSTIYSLMGLDYMNEFRTKPALEMEDGCPCCPPTYLGRPLDFCLVLASGQTGCIYGNQSYMCWPN